MNEPAYPDSVPTPLLITRFAWDSGDDVWYELAHVEGGVNDPPATLLKAKILARIGPDSAGSLLVQELRVEPPTDELAASAIAQIADFDPDAVVPGIDGLHEDGRVEEAVQTITEWAGRDRRIRQVTVQEVLDLGDVAGRELVLFVEDNEGEPMDAIAAAAPKAILRPGEGVVPAPGQLNLLHDMEGNPT